MTQAFWDRFVEEAYALIDVDWLTAKGVTFAGLSLSQLDQQMAAIR